MLESLSTDIINTIFILCSITSKRLLIRTCKKFYKYTELIPKIEKEFQTMIVKKKFFHKENFTAFTNPLYKFTIELIYDNYQIPEKYIIRENRIIHHYPKIYYRLGLQGNLDLLRKILGKNSENEYACHAMRGAAKNNHKHILKWMKKNGYQFNKHTSTYAVKGNKFDLLKWLIKHECPYDEMCTAYSAKVGNINMLRWLLKHNCEMSYGAMYLASYKNHIDILKCLCMGKVVEDIIIVGKACITGACAGGHINLLEWFKTKFKFDLNKGVDFYKAAIQKNQFECLKWLEKNGFVIDNILCFVAVAHGNIEILEWLVNKGCKLDNDMCRQAAINGHLEMLKWMINRECKLQKGHIIKINEYFQMSQEINICY